MPDRDRADVPAQGEGATDDVDADAGDRVKVAREGGVAEVRLSRPDKLNALDPEMLAAIVATGERLAAEPGLRAVVLSGEGRAFSAGLDLRSFAAIADGSGLSLPPGGLAARTHGPANLFQQAALVWRALPVPVVAAVQGVAYGGGLQIALGADIRVASPDAKLSLMEINWGLVPDMGGVLLLADLVRADILRDLVYTGRVVSGEEALALGLVTRLSADPLAAARETARAIAARSPDAIRAAKRLLARPDPARDAAILAAESREGAALLGSPNQVEAIAANLERRAPVFRDPNAQGDATE